MRRLSPAPGWRRSRLVVNPGLSFFRFGDTSLAAFRVCLFRFVAVPVCLFRFVRVPVRSRSDLPMFRSYRLTRYPSSFLTLSSTVPFHTSPPYSARSGPVRHHSVAFKATLPSARFDPVTSLSSPIILPDALTLRRPDLPCNLPHTFRQHPGRRILPHSAPFSLTKTGDTEHPYPGRLGKRNRPQSRHFRQPAIHNTEPFSPIDSYERLHPATPSCKKRFSRPWHKRKNLLKIHRSSSPGLREPQHRPPIIPPRTDYTHLTSAKSMRCGSLGFLA